MNKVGEAEENRQLRMQIRSAVNQGGTFSDLFALTTIEDDPDSLDGWLKLWDDIIQLASEVISSD